MMNPSETTQPQVRVADYIAQTLARQGVRDLFMVTGGGAMHLNDAFGKCEGLRYVCCHHEQACAMAAEGYARVTGDIGVLNVTTGPGGINALNGVYGAWTDSVPMLVISGQVKRETCLATYAIPGLRQLGDQEADIIDMVKGITKYAVLVTDPASIRYHLERALHLAASGRPGPCWLDIPIDVQAAKVDAETLSGYEPQDAPAERACADLDETCRDIIERLRQAQRPVIMVGKGVRSAGMEPLFEQIIRRLNIPVVTAWTGIDLMASDDPLFCGRPGDLGDRAGNFTVQNADVLLILGTRLGLRQVSYNWSSFAREAFKIHVDVDGAEFKKPTVKSEMPVSCDLRKFIPALHAALEVSPDESTRHNGWLAWCKERLTRYPVFQPEHRELREGMINPYRFMRELFAQLKADDIVVCGNGTANVVAFQSALIKKGQRMFCNTGDASMGYGLPAAIGAAIGGNGRRVICLDGDGSIMMNVQELQTVVHHGWPIKVFVLDNAGYLSIRQSQQRFFGRLVGESSATGISFPDFCGLATAFGMPARLASGQDFSATLRQVLTAEGPSLCQVQLDPQQGFEPRLAARALPDGRIVSPPLEDMFPFLSRPELAENLLIPTWQE